MESMLLQQERTLTGLDHARLIRLLPRAGSVASEAGIAALQAAIDNAELVASNTVSPDIVTMYSRVQLEEPATGRRHVFTLCYPPDAEPAEGFVSVMSPVGASLLGLRVGAMARWQTPGGQQVQAEVRALLFQPEASGDFTL
jgi:regulator of nucleoside diphosphate kinase